MQEREAVWQEIRNRVFQNMDLSGEISDKELKRMIAEEVRQFGKVHLLSLQAREICEEQIFNSFRKLDILQELLDDPEVTEVMVNGAAHIFYEKHGVLYPWEKGQLSEERLRDKDKRRAAYHRFYTDMKWGHAQNYHLTLNSGVLGLEKCVEIIAGLF